MSRALPAALFLVGVVALAGCGSGGSSTGTGTGTGSVSAAKAIKETAAAARAADAKAPKGASRTLRGIYRSFPPAHTGSMEPSTAKAVEAGEAACRSATPLAVKERYFSAAKANLEPQQAAMIDRIASFEANERTDQSFVAGQLAADTYAATLPEGTAQGGFRGCIYSLAKRLERRLAPAKK